MDKDLNTNSKLKITEEYSEKYKKYVELLKNRLTPKRFIHSLCVADEAVRLAIKYNCDTEKAFLAGLLHDCCKDMDAKEQLQLFERFGIMLNTIESKAPKLWHAIAGAEYISTELDIKDKDILAAVRYHTTARKGMSLLEKIIYLADFTSADRDYDGVSDMRKAVTKDLDTAMFEALDFSVKDLENKGLPVHSDTMEAYAEIAERLGKEI